MKAIQKEPVHPGVILKELFLESQKIPIEHVVMKLGISSNELKLLLKGSRRISKGLALKLANIFKTSAEFWMNLQ